MSNVKGIRRNSGGLIEATRCVLCARPTNNKSVLGKVCWQCISRVPEHIPDEQVERYALELRNKCLT